MIHSKVKICNMALAMIGADPIRDFGERNKRARMSDVFYELTRDYLLNKFDWSFARKLAKLQPLADVIAPEGMYAYQLPRDCLYPRDLLPEGSKQSWTVIGSALYCRTCPDDAEVWLKYTYQNVDPSEYSSSFVNLLSIGLAVKICPSISQDDNLTKVLTEQFAVEQANAWENDANQGNIYREYDEDPNSDSFVHPDGEIVDPELRQWFHK